MTSPRKKPPKPIGPGKTSPESERAIAWCEKYVRIPEGRFVGQPFVMAEYMREDFRAIFDNPHGTRRAIISRARKNAKTVEAALLTLIYLCGPKAKPNSQLYSAAQSREQAAVLFALAAKIVRMSPVLSSAVVVRDTAKQLYCPEMGSLYRALSAEASTAYGLSPLLVVHDELGQVRGPASPLYEALETATAAQAEPLSVVISTQAPNDGDLLSILIDDAAKGADPRTVLRVQSAPDDLDPFGEEAIRAANPAFDVFMNKAEVLAMAEDARRMPSRQSEYENLVLNRRVAANNPAVSRPLWLSNGEAPGDDWGAAPVYAGLDLSATQDLTAFVRMAWVGDKWRVRPTFWLPSEGLEAKSRADRAPYDVWFKQGHLETTPGRSVEYEWVASRLAAEILSGRIAKIGFDEWNWKFLRPWLVKAGLSEGKIDTIFEPVRQGFKTMSPAFRDLEAALLAGKVAHGNHPVLTMCAANAVVTSDPAGNRKLDKSKASGRIDGMVALCNAFSVAPQQQERAPEYRMIFV
jgi:phage terminase large subunit-like protein